MTQKKGRTYIDMNHLQKTSVMLDKNGKAIEIKQPTKGPKTLQDLMEMRRKRMGR